MHLETALWHPSTTAYTHTHLTDNFPPLLTRRFQGPHLKKQNTVHKLPQLWHWIKWHTKEEKIKNLCWPHTCRIYQDVLLQNVYQNENSEYASGNTQNTSLYTLDQWCQTDPVKGHVAAGFHSNQARTHLIQIRCVLAWLADPNQVCSCLVGVKTCSHMALYWITLTPTALDAECNEKIIWWKQAHKYEPDASNWTSSRHITSAQKHKHLIQN